MTVITPDLNHKKLIQQLILLQCAIAIFVMLVVAMSIGFIVGVSLCYGILIVAVAGLMIQYNVNRATDVDPEQGKKILLKFAAVRFAGVLALLFLGYGMGLHLLWVAAGFFIGQLVAYVFFARVFYQQQKPTS